MLRNSVSDIRAALAATFVNNNFVISRQGVKTVELLGASFIADENSIFGKPNEDYIRREIDWYKSMSLNVNDIEPPVPKIWKDIASIHGEINSNYGWCIFSSENGNQFQNVINELKRNPESRRGQMIYTRPTMHADFERDGMCDFMCCSNTMHFIRENRLMTCVNFRSQDAVFGYKNDFAWMKSVHAELANELGVPEGELFWSVGSLHIYEQHFKFIRDYVDSK